MSVRCPRLSRTPCPVPPPPDPRASTPLAFDRAAGFGIDANGFLGGLVLRAAPGTTAGQILGAALGDDIRGFYSSATGTAAFLRYQNGTLIQAWYGVLERGGAKRGRGYPLEANGGGRFEWRVTVDDHAVIGLRHPSGNSRCLNEGAVIDADCSHQWLLFAIDRSNPIATQFLLAHIDTGRCLVLSPIPGGQAGEARCETDVGQRLGLKSAGTLLPLINVIADIPTATAFNVFRAQGGKCMTRMGSTGNVVTGDCGSSGADWGLDPGP